MTPRREWLAAAASAALAGCGYHVSGKADLLPKTVRSIAIPHFENATTRVRLNDSLPSALSREFIRRTRYRIVPDPNEADAILNGAVLQYISYPTITDPGSGRLSGVQIVVILSVRLTERASGKVLYERPALEARQRYEISSDQVAYFDESGQGLQRLSEEVARQVVSAILENF